MKTIGVFLFDDVELLDFAGPLEVFSAANYVQEGLFHIETVAFTERIRVNKSNLDVKVDTLLNAETSYDLFIMPGGFGTRDIIKNEQQLQILNNVISNSERTATVCTGSLILAKLGFLKNMNATSHHLALDLLKKQDPTMTIKEGERYIDNGRFLTSAGVSAGIDMSFYILEKKYGKELRDKTARYIEYLG